MAVLLIVVGCGSGERPSAPSPATPPLVTTAAVDAAPPDAGRVTTTPMTLAATVAELLDLANAGPPNARALHDAFASRATAVTHGNANLDTPPWAKGTRGSGDVFLHFTGDLAGIALWDDSRGWGAYAELAVTRGTLGELTPVIGATKAVPRNPGDFQSGNTVAAYIERGGKTVRVFVELAKGSTDAVARVTLHFET